MKLKTINERQSNFELMRIMSMFMIVLWHCIMHSNILERTSDNLNLILELIYMFSAIHVNSFVLLSGYFGYGKEPKLGKIISLINQTWFYKAIYAIIFVCFGIVSMSTFDFILFLLPINYSFSFGTFYWFINIYIVLYFFMPYLNILIKHLSQKQHRKLLLISFIFLSLIPYFTGQQVVDNNGYHVISFMFLYLVGSYFGKYKIKDNVHFKNYSTAKKQIIYIVLLIVILLFDFFVICTNKFLNGNTNTILYYFSTITNMGKVTFSSPVVIIESVIYLLLFETFNFKNKFINKMSSLMFGVYLVHENLFVYNYIYDYLALGTSGDVFGIKVILVLIGNAILVFIVSMIIELVRKKLFYVANNLKIIQKIQHKIKKWYASI